MNTLSLSHPGRNQNPCEEQNNHLFPALTYRAEDKAQEGGSSSFDGEVIPESNQEDDDDDLIDINQVEMDQNKEF